MKNKMLGVSAVAAVTGLIGAAPASASVEPVRMQAESYAELLQPIANASEQLRIADMQAAQAEPRLIEAQYYPDAQNHHHHHHHHSHHNRRWYLRNGYYWYNGGWVLRPRRNYHHHHHHHHHHNNAPGPY